MSNNFLDGGIRGRYGVGDEVGRVAPSSRVAGRLATSALSSGGEQVVVGAVLFWVWREIYGGRGRFGVFAGA